MIPGMKKNKKSFFSFFWSKQKQVETRIFRKLNFFFFSSENNLANIGATKTDPRSKIQNDIFKLKNPQ